MQRALPKKPVTVTRLASNGSGIANGHKIDGSGRPEPGMDTAAAPVEARNELASVKMVIG